MLEVNDLAKRYGRVVALDGATFTARPGRIVGFLGPNGAGKTTTMRCIFGLARPDRGDVRWNGRLGRPRRRACGSGTCPSSAASTHGCGSASSCRYFAQQHGLRGRDADAAATRWLDRMGLGDRAKSKLEELSHGNQQRVQLAVALAHDPELLVLDEPFSGLDPIGIATMTEVVNERAKAGVGVVFSSHQLDLVEDVCEDVVIIAKGRIVAAGRHRRAEGTLRAPPSRGRGGRVRRRLARRPRRPDGPPAQRRPGEAAGARRRRPRRAPRAGARCRRGPDASPTSRRNCPSCSWRRSPRADAVPVAEAAT